MDRIKSKQQTKLDSIRKMLFSLQKHTKHQVYKNITVINRSIESESVVTTTSVFSQ